MAGGSDRERYKLLNEHFQACLDLTPAERHKYISGPAIADPEVRAELQALLNQHDRTPAAPERPAPREETRRPRPRSRGILLTLVGGLAATGLFFGARSCALGHLTSDLQNDAAADLERTVDDRTLAVRAWAERQKALARTVIDDPEFSRHVATLVQVSDETKGDAQRLLSSPSYRPVADRMAGGPPEINGRGFVVISATGVDLCAETDSIVGKLVTTGGAAYLRRTVLGEWIVSRPYPDRQFAMGMDPDFANPMMFVAGPIYDASKKLLAMAVFRFDPRREFLGLLRGGSQNILAFDEKGLLLNDWGDPEELRRHGLLPGGTDARSGFLRLRLRDPGGNLTAGHRPSSAPDAWPTTLMCRRAVEGQRGSTAAPYNDVLGRPVLGAWTWLPEWEMAIGGEEPLERVLAPAGPVRNTFAALMAFPAGLTLAALLSFRRLRSWLLRRPKTSTFGSYVLERPIGKGGMAEVFLASHEILKRPAAVKILSHPRPDPASVARFEREARLACRLGHPNAVQVFDYGETPEGRLYYAMEYVKGVTLAQLLAIENPLPTGRVVHLLRQAAGALEEAHVLGLVHRDLKPSNIMVTSRGGLGDVVKVLDFGIAVSTLGESEDFTRSVDVVGTPAYLAPERIQNPRSLDLRSDIYSFGAVAFHLLTGRNVFEGSAPAELLYQVMTAKRPSPSQFRGDPVPDSLEQLILACLSIDPQARPSSFRDVLKGLDALPARWSQDEAREWWRVNEARVERFLRVSV